MVSICHHIQSGVLRWSQRCGSHPPYRKGSPSDVTGSGAVIAGKRILTNAHLVNHASQLLVQPDKSSEKLSAKVEAIAPGIDLAVLTLDDAAFFESHPPLPFSPKPPVLQQTVYAYGYPEGGPELSITRGIVSRIEFTEYYLETEGLRIQVDAAINPGKSGGSTVADGQLIGVAFSRLQRSDNIGYIIPMEEIELFLKDVKDGHYDGKPVIDVAFQHLENDAIRSQFKLDKKTTGVLVRKVHYRGSDYALRPGDIVNQIGDHAVDNSGMVHVDSDRMIKFQYLVQRLVRDGRLPATVLRENRNVKLDIPVGPHPARLVLSLSEQPPSYFIFGPLVLTEATDDYISVHVGMGWSIEIFKRRRSHIELGVYPEPHVHPLRRPASIPRRAHRHRRPPDVYPQAKQRI